MHRTLLLVATALLACSRANADVYHGFTLIDPATHQRVENAWIVIEGRQITATGSGHTPRGPTHDLTGKFVLPGFIDAHAHITLSGIQKVEIRNGVPAVSMESDEAITQHNARVALARGVTTVRNPGGDPQLNAQYDRMIAAGRWLGPEALHAGAVIEPPPFTGGAFAYPRTEAEWNAEAAREAGLGMKYFKLYTDLREDELAAGIRAAHTHGLKAIAHLNAVSWTRAIELGIDGLEHALPTSPDLLEPEARAKYLADAAPTSTFMYRWFELADYNGPRIRQLVQLMATKHIPTDMTLTVNEIVYNIDDLDRVLPPEEVRDMHPDVRKVYKAQLSASAIGWTADDYRRARAVMPKVLAFARLLHDAGVPMMLGTDGGGGAFLAHEMQLHVRAGIPSWDVLRMATSDAAQIMGLGDRIGRIRKGYEADLVILDADPVQDVGAAAKVFGVINNGVLLKSADLLAAQIR